MEDLLHCEAFERLLVHHCTPTLAAVKPANLFTCRTADLVPKKGLVRTREVDTGPYGSALSDALRQCRAKLAPCGVHIELLGKRSDNRLVFVYRPRLLISYLQLPRVADYLSNEGYDPSSLPACIRHLHDRICGTDLQSRMSGSCSFPHEIGFFLGYPYEDVVGFIENGGEGFVCNGCWKVYANSRDAEACFCCYEDCTCKYKALHDAGMPLETLASVNEDAPVDDILRLAG